MAEILLIRRKKPSIQSTNILKNMYRKEKDRWSIAHQQQSVMPLIIAEKNINTQRSHAMTSVEQ